MPLFSETEEVTSLLTTPVVIIAFSRPDLTRRVLDVVRAAAPAKLFLVLDGPRAGHPTDAVNCAAVREVLSDIDWPCEVERRYAPRNLGCEANVELGLDWVFSQVDEAIIFEDDCIADPSFFTFATELLDRYRDDKRVWHVAGNSHWVAPALFEGRSYDFSTWASVWGWATWADRWQAHRAEFNRTHATAEEIPDTEPAIRTRVVTPAPGTLVTVSGKRHFEHVASLDDGETYGWDSHWWITIMSRAGLSVAPARNLVGNDGYGEGATHTRSSRSMTPTEHVEFPLVHPPQVVLNEGVERDLELVLLRANGRMSRAVRLVIRPLWMRGIVRRVVHSAWATSMLRLSSRLRSRLAGVSGAEGR